MGTAAAIGATALSATSSIMSGRAQARQLGMEAALNERQAKDVDLQGKQMSEVRREQLRAGLASVQALFAQQNRNLDSPTAVAIERELRKQSVRDEGAERLGFMNQAYALRTSAYSKRRAASTANTLGYINAATTIMSQGGDIMASLGKGKGKG